MVNLLRRTWWGKVLLRVAFASAFSILCLVMLTAMFLFLDVWSWGIHAMDALLWDRFGWEAPARGIFMGLACCGVAAGMGIALFVRIDRRKSKDEATGYRD